MQAQSNKAIQTVNSPNALHDRWTPKVLVDNGYLCHSNVTDRPDLFKDPGSHRLKTRTIYCMDSELNARIGAKGYQGTAQQGPLLIKREITDECEQE